ncbi:uncharacterized protein [Procambarus clarkii]|uniref:uncharacterized protein isoform X1 n=1 Tax=Procambarus clarkii TaxID=6728 RepID=UPI0037440E43
MVHNGYNRINAINGNNGNNGEVNLGGEDRRAQAPHLEALAESAVLTLMTGATKKRSWQGNKAHITHIVHAHLPHIVRQRMQEHEGNQKVLQKHEGNQKVLQERVLRDWRVYDTVSLRLLDLLFSATTTSLRLVHVRTFYRDDLISLLPRLAGLRELSFQDSTWTLSQRQLGLAAHALTTMVHLRVLKLQYCGHNLLLATLGAHCPNLQVVDVLGSQGVDDEGVWGLVTVNHAHYNALARHALAHSPKSYNNSLNVSPGGCWILAFRSLASKMLMKMVPSKAHSMQVNNADTKVEEDESNGEETSTKTGWGVKTVGEKQDQEAVMWSLCCSTLAFLDLRSTGVTQAGVTMLTQALPVHARLAYDAHIRPAFDVRAQLEPVSQTCPASNAHTCLTSPANNHRTPEADTPRTTESHNTHNTDTHDNTHLASEVQAAVARMVQIPLSAL